MGGKGVQAGEVVSQLSRTDKGCAGDIWIFLEVR